VTIVVRVAPGGGIDALAARRSGSTRQWRGREQARRRRGHRRDYVAKSAPDGYILLTTTTEALAKWRTERAVRLVNDYAPIAELARRRCAAVDPDLPVKSVADFIAYAKANPGK